jgi:HlyD family secretion protein
MVVLGALLAVAAAVLWLRSRVTDVETIRPQRADVVQTLVSLGRVAAPAEVEFAAREPTEIKQVPVSEGAHVAAGELLVQMDHAEADAIVLQAEASLEQARAVTREVTTLAKPAAAASLGEARANRDEAKRRLERDEALFRSGSLTAAEVDQSRTTLTVAASRARAAELQAAAVSSKGSQWQTAIAAETFAEAGLAVAKARLDRLAVRAPAPGTLIERDVDPGDVVQMGTRLGRMALDGPTRLAIEPDEKNLRLLAVGQPAVASAEAFAGQRFAARVEFIAPAVDAVRGTVEVRLAVDDPPPYLRTDMTVSVEIEVDRVDAALTLPSDAIRDLASDRPWVLVVEGDRAARRDVVLGLRGDALVEIREGLEASAEVLVGPAVGVEPGDRIRTSPR